MNVCKTGFPIVKLTFVTFNVAELRKPLMSSKVILPFCRNFDISQITMNEMNELTVRCIFLKDRERLKFYMIVFITFKNNDTFSLQSTISSIVAISTGTTTSMSPDVYISIIN